LNIKKEIAIKQTLGAKVLGLEKKSSDRKLRSLKKNKLKKLKYINRQDVGLEAAIFWRKRYSSLSEYLHFENNGIFFFLSCGIVILIAESLVKF